mmetsp:Transcript_28013/g.66239  ORF Transcript_28013/g.66239 Transcript_28013/m.66239 type:complete len:253 (+) Transcript_28013:54-812(+)
MASSDSSFCTLVMVAKFPTPGKSKTRLAQGVGAEQAASFASACLCDLLDRFAGEHFRQCTGDCSCCRRVLYYAPAERKGEFVELLGMLGPETSSRWHLQEMQGHSRSGMKAGEGSDLGGFLAQALVTNGADSPVMFIGTDCVTIPTAILLEAQGAAASGTAYLCPATDGGYVLLALPTAATERVFEGVVWSTSGTCQSQHEAIAREGIAVTYGPTLRDVDEEEDLRALREELDREQEKQQLCPRVSKFLNQH